MSATLWADSFVSLAAFVGLVLFMARVRAVGQSDALARRVLFGLGVLAVLVLARVCAWNTGFWLFRLLTLVSAALIPLAALLWAEGLLRRHAPVGMKRFVAAGVVVFVLLAPLPVAWLDPARLTAQMLFQLVALAAIGALVLRRDKTSLSAAENRAVERIALSLVLILPLLVTDYRIEALPVPVRMGGLAILFLCWLGLTLSRATSSHRDVVQGAAVLGLCALVAGWAIGRLAGLGAVGVVQAASMALAAGLVAAIHAEGRRLLGEARRESLLRHMARGDISSSAAFLRGLQDHPLAGGAMLLGPDDLAELDLDLLQRGFAQSPVRARAGLEAEPDAALREQLAFLFARFEATHLVAVGARPLRLLTLAMPQLTNTPGAETELAAVQRMAMLIERAEASPPTGR